MCDQNAVEEYIATLSPELQEVCLAAFAEEGSSIYEGRCKCWSRLEPGVLENEFNCYWNEEVNMTLFEEYETKCLYGNFGFFILDSTSFIWYCKFIYLKDVLSSF